MPIISSSPDRALASGFAKSLTTQLAMAIRLLLAPLSYQEARGTDQPHNFLYFGHKIQEKLATLNYSARIITAAKKLYDCYIPIMRWHHRFFYRVFAITILLTTTSIFAAQAKTAQQNLQALYFRSMSYPETFDNYINNMQPIPYSLYQCIGEARQRLSSDANFKNQLDKTCDTLPYEDRAVCKGTNEAEKLVLYLDTLEARLTNQISSWDQTIFYQSSLLIIQMFGRDVVINLMNNYKPIINYALRCSY